MDLGRVVVVGTSCSGKTTFACRLASILGVPHVDLDALYWGAGWTPRPEFHQDVLDTAGHPRWVVTRERLYGGNRETIRNAFFEREGIPWW